MEFKKLKDSKFVVVKEKTQTCLNGNKATLAICKYKREVFFNNLWNAHPETMKARGIVFDAETGDQIVYPMNKCFNYLENCAGSNLSDNEPIIAFQKLNGFMVNLTYNSLYGWIVSTTGDALILGNESTCTNKYLLWAAEHITDEIKFQYTCIRRRFKRTLLGLPYTLTFELCHKDDPHIVQEQEGLHLLCLQTKHNMSLAFDTDKTLSRKMTLGELKEKLTEVKHEGFMVYDYFGTLLFKMKSPYYLAKKWVQRRNADQIWSPLYKERMDEEYYPIVQRIREVHTKPVWDMLTEQGKSDIFMWAYNDIYGNSDNG